MNRLLQHGSGTQPKPLSLRFIAVLCVLVVCLMSTAQMCHTHPEQSPLKQNSRQGALPDDHCPICTAMHSALPVALHVAPEPILKTHTLDTVAADAERIFRWRFEMASRPPPARSLA